jgi:hypothetical protein
MGKPVDDLYFEPKYEEFQPHTIWSFSNAFTSAFGELDHISPVFSGVVGAPAQCFLAQASCRGSYTTIATIPVTRKALYLYMDSHGNYNVFVPWLQSNSLGTTWAGGATPGSSIPIKKFLLANPTGTAADDQLTRRCHYT